MLRDREAALMSDVETVKHQKEKELQLQMNELEFFLKGARHAVLFSEAMVNEGSDIDIVTDRRQVMARLATLINEQETTHLEPVTDVDLELVGKQEGMDLLSSAIKDYAGVADKIISAEESIIEGLSWRNHLKNQVCSFKVILLDKEGAKTSATKERNKGAKGLAIEVTDPQIRR